LRDLITWDGAGVLDGSCDPKENVPKLWVASGGSTRGDAGLG
jgi:hypothetical protein